jgi:hypothetical protein
MSNKETFDEAVALKWAISQLKKKIEENPTGAIKMPLSAGNKPVVRYTEMKAALELIVQPSIEGRLKVVKFCSECPSFSGGNRVSNGCCFPNNYTSRRGGNDYCSLAFVQTGKGKKG